MFTSRVSATTACEHAHRQFNPLPLVENKYRKRSSVTHKHDKQRCTCVAIRVTDETEHSLRAPRYRLPCLVCSVSEETWGWQHQNTSTRKHTDAFSLICSSGTSASIALVYIQMYMLYPASRLIVYLYICVCLCACIAYTYPLHVEPTSTFERLE